MFRRFTTTSMSMKRMAERVTFEHYRVLQHDDGSLWKLGSGAMGVTYKALDTDLQCPVALKVIKSDLMADEVNRNRFLREARAAAGLRHGNVASVYHLVKDNEQFFYAMEFIDGETTEAYVKRCGPMSLRAALRVAWQVSKALIAATRQKLVHRDIKPANIMILADSEEEDWPCIKLIDFGLVRSVLRSPVSASATGSGFLGTAQFASPEQIEENEVDVRSDIYSLGCTLWYLLTGEAPFSGSLASVFAQHLGSEPSWEKLRPFPKRIRRLLRRMLQKEPSQRPPDAVELRREIEQCVDNIERRQALTARMTLPLNIGCQWLTAPRSRGAVICGVSVISAMLVFGYNANQGTSPQAAPAVQSSDVVPAQSSADSKESSATKNPGWLSVDTSGEPFWSLGSARRVALAETEAPDTGAIGAKDWSPEESTWDAEVGELFAFTNDFRGGEDPFSAAITLDQSFSANAGENGNVAVSKVSIRDKDEVRKTSKSSAKKPQRRVTSRDRDRGFSPMLELQRAREKIRRTIRRIL